MNSGDAGTGEVGDEDEPLFVECYSSSESEEGDRKHHGNCQPFARPRGGSSPPLLLAFSGSAGPGLQDSSPSSASQLEADDDDDDQPIEEWMILGGEEQVGDSSIQLNLGYWTGSEEDAGDEDRTVKPGADTWAVSEKDKCGGNLCPFPRYFEPDCSLVSQMCNTKGHLAKRCYCYNKKSSVCILCGIQGHVQRDCPENSEILSRLHCGLPSHGLKSCENPPVWNQHCQRCWMTGHLSDACPDTWRQYHLTIHSEVPRRPQTVHTHKHKRGQTHCYNCSRRGHYGFECSKKKMVSGTFPSLPYVCYYDTMEDVCERRTKMQKMDKDVYLGLRNAEALPPSDQHHLSESKGESGEESRPVQGNSRTKQEARSQTGKRKTWPVRRKERREIKRLRREAQAMRGGLLVETRCNSEHDACPADLYKYPLHSHRASAAPLERRRLKEANGRKSKEAEMWKKRGRMKWGDLYPHADLATESEKLLSPKQRVRHRRR